MLCIFVDITVNTHSLTAMTEREQTKPDDVQIEKHLFSFDNLNPFVNVSLFLCSKYLTEDTQHIAGGMLIGTGVWVTIIFVMRNVLKSLLSWHGWMYSRHGSMSITTKIWLVSSLC